MASPEELAAQKARLTNRRATLLAQLDRAEQFVVQYDAGRDELEVPIRLENLEALWASLDEVQATLEDLETTEDGKAANLAARAAFEPKLFRIKANLRSKLPPPIPLVVNRPPEPPSRPPSTLSSLKLPTISLPEFNGDYRQWLTFHDTFKALIHDNEELPVIQRFHYLRAALKGEAAQLIEAIAISAANYPLAWDSLVSRYSNEYLLKKRHLQDMLDVPRMKRETAAALHSTLDEFQRHVKILKQLGEPTDEWSTLLEHLLCSRLHDDTIKAWEDHAATVEDQSYSCMVEFLEKRVRVLESISANHHGAPNASAAQPSGSHNRKPFVKMSSHAVTESSFPKCYACDSRHLLVKCPRFMAMSAAERLRLVNSKRLCVNCFRQDHFARDCANNYTCRVCRKRHHSLLHSGFSNAPSASNPDAPSNAPSSSVPSSSNSQSSDQRRVQSVSAITKPDDVQCANVARDSVPTVFMLTVVLRIVDAYGKEHYARALLDSGSQPNLMTDRLAQLLRLKRQRSSVEVQGIGEKPEYATETVTTEIRSRKGSFARNVSFLILRKMTSNLPASTVPVDHWKLPSDIFLADPGFNRSSTVDLILGSQHFFDFFPTSARIQLSKTLPILVDSEFGWIVAGGEHLVPASKNAVCCTVTVSMSSLEESMERFWKVEELNSRPAVSVEEQFCEDYYASTVSRTKEGRYVVRYPKRENFETMIGESKQTALRQFRALEKRFESNPELKASYVDFMQEYEKLGHMRRVEEDESSQSPVYYLPHHPVIKKASTTTQTRVVYNGSSKTASGFSLNDALCVGPVIQDDLLTLVIRFRKFPVAVVADIAKMYRQILAYLEDALLQRIIWRFCTSDPLSVYELLTVTYGLAPSSFLATRTLQQLANDEGHSYPLGGPALRKSFYVDDFIGGANSIPEAIQLRKELTELLAKGGFPIRKWTSNKLEVLEGLEADSIGIRSSVQFDAGETVRTLGISWEPEPDQFLFEYNVNPNVRPNKRSILSAIAQLFDPLGMVAPMVIRGKMIMQELWLTACSWDDEIPESLKQKWEAFYQEIPFLSNFRIDRYALQPGSSVQIHTFADASENAYGACTYARSVDSEGNVRSLLLAAKTRVAPLKRLSIPKLELCAAVIAAQLHCRILKAWEMETAGSFLWSDSTVALQWLKSPPNTWKTFVANRVSEIQTTTHGAQWNHVAGSQNPADLLSRGMKVADLLESNLWKTGPAWLSRSEDEWPISKEIEAREADMERKLVVTAVVRTKPKYHPIFTRYSQLSRLTRIVAYCMKFANNARSKARTCPIASDVPNPTLALTVEQLSHARTKLVRLAQADGFQDEIRDLEQNCPLKKQSSVRLLHPFLDVQGVLRVGGRLRLADRSYESKHPALIPSFHPLAKLLAISFHTKLIHGGGRLTLAVMREEYWPVQGRRLVRSVIRNCMQCARANPVPVRQQIGQIPASRITPSRPFSVTGVDYAGPVYLKAIHKRASPTKAYICVFVCFTTKAVHLELVSDLSTPAFLTALRRFVARRGRPSHIYSDNGKNFIGAKNELHSLYRRLTNAKEVEKVQRFCADEQITWHLNPPKAPHFGGLWEAAVKVAKAQLYRQLGRSHLSFEQMSTVLAEIEAAMNSRPLVPMTEDPSDCSAITPAHFLIGTSMHAVPDLDLSDASITMVNRHQRLQYLFQQFWHNWRREYLQELQRDTTRCQANREILPGRLVVLVDEFQHPTRWTLARIEAVHPGADGLVRVVTLRTAKGSMTRPTTKICLLPTERVNREGVQHRAASIGGDDQPTDDDHEN